MNIYYLSDNTARLTPTTGSIRNIISNRVYKEVRCSVDAVSLYTDGYPNEAHVVRSVVRYSKYKIMLLAKALDLWEDLKAMLQQYNLQDSWANIVDIASDNEELQRALPFLYSTFGQETVDSVLRQAVAD